MRQGAGVEGQCLFQQTPPLIAGYGSSALHSMIAALPQRYALPRHVLLIVRRAFTVQAEHIAQVWS